VKTIHLYRSATKHDDAALMRELEALEPVMKDPGVARAVGLALVERIREAEAPAEFRERAFALLDQALSMRPDDAEAAWGFGIVAAQLNRQLPLAESRLKHADELVPRSADLAMSKALVYEAMGQPSRC
jgi:Flp pilus assembly protein TadD